MVCPSKPTRLPSWDYDVMRHNFWLSSVATTWWQCLLQDSIIRHLCRCCNSLPVSRAGLRVKQLPEAVAVCKVVFVTKQSKRLMYDDHASVPLKHDHHTLRQSFEEHTCCPAAGCYSRAFKDCCPHRQAPLSEGRVDQSTGHLFCNYHGETQVYLVQWGGIPF